jgi:O-antigen ligase
LILEEALVYFQTAGLSNILFGIGFSTTEYFLLYGAHNYFLMYLMESGAIGLLLMCATVLVFIKISDGKVMIILLPFIIQTMAASSPFLPYFYVIIAFIIISKNDSEKNSLLLD